MLLSMKLWNTSHAIQYPTPFLARLNGIGASWKIYWPWLTEDRIADEILAFIPAKYDTSTNDFIEPTDTLKTNYTTLQKYQILKVPNYEI